MNRREIIGLLGGAAAAWPLAARAQQAERMRRIGVLMSTASDHLESKARLAAFLQRLQGLGWVDGRNVRVDVRWPGSDARIRSDAAELAALAPDVILATGTSGLSPLLAATRTVPIVFVAIADPVGGGFVESMARPGGNATGFTVFEYAIGAKWLELLKQIAPGLTRAAVLRDSQQISGGGQFGAIQAVAPSFGVELSPIDLRDAGEVERALAAFARNQNGGLIVTAGGMTLIHRELIIALAARREDDRDCRRRLREPYLSWRRSTRVATSRWNTGRDLGGIAHVDRADLHPDRRRGRLDYGELADPRD